ncbi:putative retrovirus-related pol polyprotein from transposon opus, partial [Trichonephila clavipes]
IATSHTTPYNPAGNGQVERYNGIIGKTIQLALRSNSAKTEQWEGVIQTSIPFAPCCVQQTNATSRTNVFSSSKIPFNGSFPYLLGLQSLVQFCENQMRANKYEPPCSRSELIEANPDYAHVNLVMEGKQLFYKTLGPRGKNYQI